MLRPHTLLAAVVLVGLSTNVSERVAVDLSFSRPINLLPAHPPRAPVARLADLCVGCTASQELAGDHQNCFDVVSWQNAINGTCLAWPNCVPIYPCTFEGWLKVKDNNNCSTGPYCYWNPPFSGSGLPINPDDPPVEIWIDESVPCNGLSELRVTFAACDSTDPVRGIAGYMLKCTRCP